MSDAYGQPQPDYSGQPAPTPGWTPDGQHGHVATPAPHAPAYAQPDPGYPTYGATVPDQGHAAGGYPAQAPAFPAAGYPAPAQGYPGAGYPTQPGYPTQAQGYPAAPYGAYPQPGAYGQPAPFLGEKPKNGLATAALVLGIAVVGVLVFANFAIASALAVLISIRAIARANQIKRSGYHQAVGMTRAIIGLSLSAIGLLSYVLIIASR